MRILCLGSLNMDYIYQVSHIVQPGETLTSEMLDPAKDTAADGEFYCILANCYYELGQSAETVPA